MIAPGGRNWLVRLHEPRDADEFNATPTISNPRARLAPWEPLQHKLPATDDREREVANRGQSRARAARQRSPVRPRLGHNALRA